MDREQVKKAGATLVQINLALDGDDEFPSWERRQQAIETLKAQEQRIEELEKHNKEMRLALLDDIARESQELGLYDED